MLVLKRCNFKFLCIGQFVLTGDIWNDENIVILTTEVKTLTKYHYL